MKNLWETFNFMLASINTAALTVGVLDGWNSDIVGLNAAGAVACSLLFIESVARRK